MKKTFITVIIVFSVFVLSGLSFAGGGPTTEKCEDLGMIDVTCVICSTGQKTGMVSIDAAYDPAYDDCMLYYKEALRKCASTYETALSETGIKWEYWIGATRYYGHAPASCVTSQKSFATPQAGAKSASPSPGSSKFSGKD